MAAIPPSTSVLICKHQRHLLRSTALVDCINRKEILHCCSPVAVAVDLLIRSAPLISWHCSADVPWRCVQLSSPTRQSVVGTPKS